MNSTNKQTESVPEFQRFMWARTKILIELFSAGRCPRYSLAMENCMSGETQRK